MDVTIDYTYWMHCDLKTKQFKRNGVRNTSKISKILTSDNVWLLPRWSQTLWDNADQTNTIL